MNKKTNKKGSFLIGTEIISYILLFGVIAVAMISVIIVLGSQGTLKVPEKLRGEIMAEGLLNNENCFAYKDPITEREGLGKIELEKITEERLNKCLEIDGKHFPARIELEYQEKGKTKKLTIESKSFTYPITSQYFIKKKIIIVKQGKEQLGTITIRVGNNAY